MTIWDKIYKNYKKSGEEYATLSKGLIPEFISFINENNFTVKKVLDIGCGNGKYLKFLKELSFDISGIDSSPTAIEMCKETLGQEVSLTLADMYKYDYPSLTYDLIISIACLHHGLKEQVRKAIKNIYKSLLPGGYVFITLPDNEGSSHWTMMTNHKEIEPGTRIPLSGPEKGLPHSAFSKKELEKMFSDFSNVNFNLLADRGRWIITGKK